MNITPYEIKILSQQVEELQTHLANCRDYDIRELTVQTKIGLKGARKLLADLNWSLELDIALPLEKRRHNPIETTNDYPGITNAKYLIDPHTGRAAPRIEWWDSGRGDTDMPGLWDEGLEEISAFDYFHLKSFAPPDEKLKEPANPVVEKLKEELENFRKQLGELTTEDIENLAVEMGRGAKGWAQAVSACGLNSFMVEVEYLSRRRKNNEN